jgi:hypothetical protein
MAGYAGAVMLLNTFVQCLLLMGTARLCRCSVPWQNLLLGGVVGGLYAGACLLTRFAFLGASLWRMLVYAAMSVLSFGITLETVRCGAIFVLLNMALEGITVGLGKDNLQYCLIAMLALGLLCFLGFQRKNGGGAYIPVELMYKGRECRLTALQDTGNLLTDPLSGQSVLVVDAKTAGNLTGLTAEELAKPLETMVTAALPGLRLIPYKTIGQGGAFLLALRMQGKIGNRAGNFLVAFAPEGFSGEGKYQALAGGIA